MEFQKFDSFESLGKSLFNPEEVIGPVWSDIQKVCQHKPQGFKKNQEAKDGDQAFLRAIGVLQVKFSTPQEFKAAIRDRTFQESSGIEKQVLFHFADKWEQFERQKKIIEEKKGQTKDNVEILIYGRGLGAPNRPPLTNEQMAEERARRKQSKADRQRNETAWESK